MKTVAVIHADLESSPIGTAGRLSEPIAGIPVLARTLHRLSRAQRLDEMVVACPPTQLEQVQTLIDLPDVRLHPFESTGYPTRAAVRTRAR